MSESKAKLQLEVSENEILIFSTSKFMTPPPPWNLSIDHQGLCGPHITTRDSLNIACTWMKAVFAGSRQDHNQPLNVGIEFENSGNPYDSPTESSIM